MIARKCYVAGRVQGVYYRATVAGHARELGVTGHARNLGDGRVEVVAWATEESFDRFLECLWRGSSAAKVASIDVQTIDTAATQRPLAFSTG